MEIWFDVIKRFSRRDQLSFNYAAWKAAVPFKYIELNVWDNSWFCAAKHLTKRDIEYCYVYYGDSQNNFDLAKYFDYKYKIKSNTFSFSATIPNDTDRIEFNPVNVIGTLFDNIVISPKPKKIRVDGGLKCRDSTIFCTNRNIITTFDSYKKGQKLTFSIDLKDIDRDSLDKFLESYWIDHNKITFLQEKSKILQKQVDGLETAYNDILNSKSWRTLDKLRKVKQIFKKSSK